MYACTHTVKHICTCTNNCRWTNTSRLKGLRAMGFPMKSPRCVSISLALDQSFSLMAFLRTFLSRSSVSLDKINNSILSYTILNLIPSHKSVFKQSQYYDYSQKLQSHYNYMHNVSLASSIPSPASRLWGGVSREMGQTGIQLAQLLHMVLAPAVHA